MKKNDEEINDYLLNDKAGKKLMRGLLDAVAKEGFFSGEIKAEDFKNKDILAKKLHAYLNPKGGRTIELTMDYTETLLLEAEKYSKSESFELAYVFLATFFEHQINGILDVSGKKQKIPRATITKLIRNTSLEDKFTWVLNLLKLPNFKNSHWKTIKLISEKRNNFIHFKYLPEDADLPASHERDEWQSLSNAIKASIKYMKSYTSRVSYHGKKRLITI